MCPDVSDVWEDVFVIELNINAWFVSSNQIGLQFCLHFV